jgi:hypothetical protein
MDDIDKTFERLRKPTYDEMIDIWRRNIRLFPNSTLEGVEYTNWLRKFYPKYGWTLEEITIESTRRGKYG